MILLFSLWMAIPAFATSTVYQLNIDAPIHPVTMRFVEEAIERSEMEKAEALIIQMDTPGGLMESMRGITKAILNADVPVIVYVAPEGARAGSAGVFITLAAHIAAMAPSTNIGAATPVTMGGGGGGGEEEGKEKSEEAKSNEMAMRQKMTNDAVAQAKTIAERRGRNVEWAEAAVREAASITASEALENNVIDYIAESVSELLVMVHGDSVEVKSGTVVLDTEKADVKVIEYTWRDKFLLTIANPNLAYLLMLLGMYGLIFELYNPGAVIPGVIGVIAIILAFFAFQTLPLNWAGLLLIVVAIAMFILEIKVTSMGFLTLGGTASLIIGSIMLFDSPIPALRVSWSVIIPTVIVTVLFFAVALAYGIRAQKNKVTTGHEGLVGEKGIAVSELNPNGRVKIGGEYWKASAASESISEGANIVVTGGDRLMLIVREDT
ncbi:nodulation protein NfeD [bacterium]|nr:nodulation protein NfeD [bacterium]